MADDNKKDTGWNFDPLEAFIVLLFLTAILTSVISVIWSYFTSGEVTFYGFNLSGIFSFFKSNVEFFKTLGFVIAGFAAIGTFVFNKKGDQVVREVKAKLYPQNMPMVAVSGEEPAKDKMIERWEKIIKLSESENSSDWRLAIIEADIILDELLEKLQLPGETMGEKLKAVEQSDFVTIDLAWEAHKARNAIAHEGGNFLINQREVRRVISLYAAVFKEFCLI